MQRRHPMQGITTAENLQVPWHQLKPPDEAFIPVQNPLNARIVLVRGGSQGGAVLEGTPLLGILNREGDGVVVGVEMPRKSVAFLGEIDDDIRQRVAITMEVRLDRKSTRLNSSHT